MKERKNENSISSVLPTFNASKLELKKWSIN